MGIPGMMGLIKREGQREWSSPLRLQNSRQPRMDRFGSNMVEYGRFIRDFFVALQRSNVKPIVVYDGGRPSEQQHGRIASKAAHLEKSARIRMFTLQRYGNHLKDTVWPEVHSNVIRQVVNEMNLDSHPVQCVYETYPMLVRLADHYDCPVFTSHSDFILANVRNGLILPEEFIMPPKSHLTPRESSEISCFHVYQHRLLLGFYGLQQCSQALSTLWTILRPDFSGRHYMVLNRLFSHLPQHLAFRADDTRFEFGRRPQRIDAGNRLRSILQNWPKHLTNRDAVRTELVRLSGSNNNDLLAEYDTINMTFNEPLDFEHLGAIELVPGNIIRLFNVQQAMTRRESSASFLLDIFMRQTNFNRGQVEDTDTFRSTYSLADPVKLHLLEMARLNKLPMLDRQYNQLERRDLIAGGEQLLNNPSDQVLYELFYFHEQVNSVDRMVRYMREKNLSTGLALNGNLCQQIVVLLQLGMFAFTLAFRPCHDNPKPGPTVGGSSDGSQQQQVAPRSPASNQRRESLSTGLQVPSVGLMDPVVSKYNDQFKRKYFYAIYNMFMYYASKTRDDNSGNSMLNIANLTNHPSLQSTNTDDSFISKIRLAEREIDSPRISGSNPDISDARYTEMKHLVEMLNSSIHAYCELNSLYNYPGVKLQLTKYYDGVLLYRILKYYAAKTRPALMELEEGLVQLLNLV